MQLPTGMDGSGKAPAFGSRPCFVGRSSAEAVSLPLCYLSACIDGVIVEELNVMCMLSTGRRREAYGDIGDL
jgi:hypothetical protein